DGGDGHLLAEERRLGELGDLLDRGAAAEGDELFDVLIRDVVDLADGDLLLRSGLRGQPEGQHEERADRSDAFHGIGRWLGRRDYWMMTNLPVWVAPVSRSSTLKR